MSKRFSTTLPKSASGWRRLDARDLPSSTVVIVMPLTTAGFSSSSMLYSYAPHLHQHPHQLNQGPRTKRTLASASHSRASHSSNASKKSAAWASPTPRAPARREQLVDDARHALERAHPVAVPAPEHREARARELVPLQALQPLEEVRGVVRGLAWVPRVSGSGTRKMEGGGGAPSKEAVTMMSGPSVGTWFVIESSVPSVALKPTARSAVSPNR